MNINRYKTHKKCAICTLASALVVQNRNGFLFTMFIFEK